MFRQTRGLFRFRLRDLYILSRSLGGVARSHFTVGSNSRSGFPMADSVPSPDSVSTDFLVLIGRIVIGWGQVERVISLSVTAAKSLVPNHFRKDVPPQGLGARVKALRSICGKLPSFVGKTEWVNRRLDDVLEIADIRHTIVHGFFHGISGETEPQIYFRRAPPLSGESGRRLLATRSELEDLITKMNHANHSF